MACVANYATSDLTTHSYSLSSAPLCQFRFIDFQHLLNSDSIRILAFSELPTRPFATVSYVWKGIEPKGKSSKFKIEGIRDEYSLSIDVLKTTCIAASMSGCELLWLDKLSIRQDRDTEDGGKDNAWQVQNMHSIYKGCKLCLVNPGGLKQLASLEERTSWIERAWTLQEALAPPSVKCLFFWTKGNAVLQHNAPIIVREVVLGKAAMADMKSLLEGSLKSNLSVILDSQSRHPDNYDGSTYISLKILGIRDGSDVHPIVALLGALDHTLEDGRANAIWRCTILRSAKFAEDMIYSIMGLLGVTLEVIYPKPGQPSDLSTPVIGLTRALMQKGFRADWLGIAPGLGAPYGMSAMPILPMSTEKGAARIKSIKGNDVEVKEALGTSVDTMWWWLKDAPKGVVDEDGNLTFKGRAISIAETRDTVHPRDYSLQRDHPDTIVELASKRAWKILSELKESPYAIVVGSKERYLSGIFSSIVDLDTTLLMLVEESEVKPKRYRNLGYAWADQGLGKSWTERVFTVGG